MRLSGLRSLPVSGLYHVGDRHNGAIKTQTEARGSGSISAEAAGLQKQDKSNAAALRWLRILRTGPQGETGRIPAAVHRRYATNRAESGKQSAVVQEERKAEWDER